MKRLSVIDLDSIVYVVAWKQREERLPMIVTDATKDFITQILTKTEAEAYLGFYQVEGHNNYRKIYYPEYKANRPEAPDYIKLWRPVIHAAFKEFKGITGLKVIESDDALSVVNNTLREEYDITLCHIDKDLNCLPGRHYNYNSGKFYDISTIEGRQLADVQVLSGDSGDHIPGVPGIGKVKAKKYLETNDSVIKAYKAACKDKKVDTWIRNFNRDFSCINLLNSLQELKKYTQEEEVNLFNIDLMEYEDTNLSNIENWD